MSVSSPLFSYFPLLIFFTFSISSNALHHPQPSTFAVAGHGFDIDGAIKHGHTYNHRRFMAETSENSSSLILAANNTRRKDPLDNFKLYNGGWNISDQHYWASVAFTAAPFFVVAAVWFVFFGLLLICTCLYFCCCRRAPYGYSRFCYALSLIFLILFTTAAIIGCIVLYIGQGRFHASTKTTLHFAVNQANYVARNLTSVSDYLSEAKNIGVGQVKLPENLLIQINDIQTKISRAATTIQDETEGNSKRIQGVLNLVRMALIILAAVMLFLAFIGFLLSIFGLQCLVYTLIVLGWLLVTLTFILCGIFLVLHNVVADTCISMNQWAEHPAEHTALDDILPCVEKATAQEALMRTKQVTYQLVNMVDVVLTNVSNANFPPSTPPPLYYNQSGPPVPLLCNPLNPDLSNRTCAPGEVDFQNATQVWKNYVCQSKHVPGNEICTTTGRVTPTIYSQMNSAQNVSFALYHYSPFLVDVIDCTFARTLFSDFHANYCPDLRKYTQWIYIGLLLVSAAVMLSLILWVVYARERRHRAFTKAYLAG